MRRQRNAEASEAGLYRNTSPAFVRGIAEHNGGSRRGQIPGIRSRLTGRLIEEYGLSLAEIGRQLGVTTSAVSKVLNKRQRNNLLYSQHVPDHMMSLYGLEPVGRHAID